MRADSAMLAALARGRDLLTNPSAENLGAFAAELKDALARMGAAGPSPAAAVLARQIRALYEQAGRLKLEAARIGEEAEGYTSAGRVPAGRTRPRLAVTG